MLNSQLYFQIISYKMGGSPANSNQIRSELQPTPNITAFIESFTIEVVQLMPGLRYHRSGGSRSQQLVPHNTTELITPKVCGQKITENKYLTAPHKNNSSFWVLLLCPHQF